VLALGGVGLIVFAAGVGVGGLIVFGLHKANFDDPPERRVQAAYSDVEEPGAGELAERFRPWLLFDSSERWRPLEVSRLLAESGRGAPAHRFCTQTGARAACSDIEDEAGFRRKVDETRTLGQSSYVDLAGGKLGEYRGPRDCAPPLLDCGDGAESAIYYHVTKSNDRLYVDYWWFLRFNNFQRTKPRLSCASRTGREQQICGEHEGDWEGVTVVTRPGEDDELDYVVYAAHSGAFRYAAAEIGRRGDMRPKVFVARGSHASYPRRCAASCDQPIAVEGLLTLPEAEFDGGAGWERNAEDCPAGAPGSCLLPLPRPQSDARAWTVWPGRWGGGCGDVCRGAPGPDSPRSPGLQERYQSPWCSTSQGAFSCDGRALGCGDWLGPLVAAVACRPDLLAAGLRDPEANPAGGLALKVRGEEKVVATTPGVVQALGAPLGPGEAVTVTSGGPGSQVLVRAQDGRYVVEARFDRLGLAEGEAAVIRIERGARAPEITLGDERRSPVDVRTVEIDAPPS
jgi:hypothetical protein